MGPEGAVNIVFRRELADADDPEARREELIADYKERFANPYAAAERGYVDDVIEPRRTRPVLIDALETALTEARRAPPAQAREHSAVSSFRKSRIRLRGSATLQDPLKAAASRPLAHDLRRRLGRGRGADRAGVIRAVDVRTAQTFALRRVERLIARRGRGHAAGQSEKRRARRRVAAARPRRPRARRSGRGPPSRSRALRTPECSAGAVRTRRRRPGRPRRRGATSTPPARGAGRRRGAPRVSLTRLRPSTSRRHTVSGAPLRAASSSSAWSRSWKWRWFPSPVSPSVRASWVATSAACIDRS